MNRIHILFGSLSFMLIGIYSIMATPHIKTSYLIYTLPALAPTVVLGDSILAITETQIEIKGTVSEDVIKLEWKRVEGPSDVILKDADSLTVKISNLKEGTYLFSLTGTNSDGESATDQVEVRVNLAPSGPFVLVPKKIVTPNNDGFNDTWDIQYIGTRPAYTVIIMDSKGRKVLEKTNFTSDVVWDGLGAGYGAYYYVIKDENQKEYRTGSFSLLQ